MQRKELRPTTVYYCDLCGQECGLPYKFSYGIGWGPCCSDIESLLWWQDMAKKEIRKQPFFGKQD